MIKFRIENYVNGMEKEWDRFIEKESYNGTFLQSRNFLDYHPSERFKDNSLIVFKGDNTIAAVIPACIDYEDNKKVLFSHLGSTFGGIVFGKQFYDISHTEALMDELEKYLMKEKFNKVVLKQSSRIFVNKDNDLLEYFLFKNNYKHYSELSFVINLDNYDDNIINNFNASRRRYYRNAEKNNLKFKKLSTPEEIKKFHEILTENLMKFEAVPVHTYEELMDFKNHRLRDIVDFYGVYQNDNMISGSMIFMFGKSVFHTQYLAAAQEHLKLYPNNYMDANLIMTAKKLGFKYFSFGISTEEHGKVLNKSLAEFKEGFGTGYCNNKVWYKEFK